MSILPATKQRFPCTNALCCLSTTSLYHKLSINIQLEGVDSDGAAWRSRSLRMRVISVVWWEGAKGQLWAEQLLLVSGYYRYVHGCSNQIIFAR